MPSDSIAGFFDRAKASRILFADQVEQLYQQPDFPSSNLDSLCQYLEEHGVLTRFQAEAICQGRNSDLSFATYPIIDVIGPCPGGTAYRALHPSLRTPIELRRFKPEALFPTDTATALLDRARSAGTLHHPNLVTQLDVGQQGEEAFVAIEQSVDAGPLDVLVRDIGAMPSFLAAEYGRQAASALRAAHERGLWHGDVRPAHLLVGPMTTKSGPDGVIKRRPAPNAAAKLAELGLVPKRPAAVLSAPDIEVLPYLPPERLENAVYEPRGDLYSLGATLYFLLTGRPPHTGSTASELIAKVRSADPAPLTTLRPDVPAGFAEVVHRLLNKRPNDRPATSADVEEALTAVCRPGPTPTKSPASGPVPMAVAHVEDDAPAADAHPSSADEWGAGDAFSTAHASTAPMPKRELTAKDKSRTRLLVILGLCLHISAVALIIAFCAGMFNSSPEPEPAPTHKDVPKKTKKK